MTKGRVEAFSDGVLAVAITLLVLDLHIKVGEGSVAEQLRHEWPAFAAYAMSFIVIGVIWVNHHALLSLVARVDRWLLFYNLLLLLFVSTIPFTTSTLASYLRAGGSDARWAVVLYGVSTEGMAVSFTLILAHLVRRQLMYQPVGRADGRRAVFRFGLGTIGYPVIVALGLWSPTVMLVAYALMSLFYMFDQTPIMPGAAETDSDVSARA